MAKNESKRLVEMLDKEIVKDEDKLYKVPDNWVLMYGHILKFIKGKKPQILTSEKKEGLIPYVNIKCFETGMPEQYAEANSTNKFCNENDVLIVWDGARAGLVGKGVSGALGSTLCKIGCPQMINDYLFYFMQSSFNGINKNVRGTGIPHVNPTYIYSMQMPIPPLQEQQRIVNLVESLFERLDRAKELVQDALDSFENRKSVILHQAFSGELTLRWREDKGLVKSWETKKLREISKCRGGYAFDSSKFTDSGYQVIRIGNLYNGVLDLSRSPVFIDKTNIDDKLVEKSRIWRGTILLTLTGTKYKRDYGNAVFIDSDSDILLNQRILSIKSESVEEKYLLFFLESSFFRDVFFSNETGGVNQGNVSSKFVENIEIPVPSISEQLEIINILELLTNNEKKTEENCKNVIESIDFMKKAILSKAFRGEFGTNNNEDESTWELLGSES